MDNAKRIAEIVSEQTDTQLETIYRDMVKRFGGADADAADLIAQAIESEYASRNGWSACEQMTDRAAS